MYKLLENLHIIEKAIIKPDKQFSFLSYVFTGSANVLIDTVPERSAQIFLNELERVIGPQPLDAIIMNHSEEDHSGALPYVVSKRPEVPIYCTEACKTRLSQVLPLANFKIVKTGDVVILGTYQFTFFETPGLHWNDNMVTYWETEKILFSNDLFGQYAGAEPPIDKNYSPEALLDAAKQYYEKVFAAATIMEKLPLHTLTNLPLKTIAPGHGVVLKHSLPQIIAFYKECING